jgi:hypothetical protein
VYIFDWKSRNKHRCALAIAGKTVFAQFPHARSILRSFSNRKMKDDDKKVHPTIGSRFRIFSSPFGLCQSKKKCHGGGCVRILSLNL